ncbi:PREDICTED: uncharacterized protein LOC104800896 isoform X2 [Tarenaya hassleriana]|uniref:uncharacterized protein LOC104800896 isoform X2 n=1 Tax=Tarenaya hassleriana TaxID=28532 RepID=UPI00053CA8E5|nr:PREDICTED: uncharacterized protein LOC104800896 isoform X2 [Tarenaya hassleriana]
MGVMSRRVLPVCGNLCFFCPSLRARSRQPVKRYKKMLAEIFPRNQEAEPNDRKISKLCEYSSRNPLRIPKITDYLEQKCYKELRNGNIGSVKVVLCVYKKLLSSCKEQMPLFSSSLLSIIRTLLEQTRQEEVQILGCNSLVDFISFQSDNSHMFNLEGLTPTLCQLAEEVGDDERSLRLRSAGIQALAYMVSFMGEHSQISMDFDSIISVILGNYMDIESNQVHSEEVCGSSKTENHQENGLRFPNSSGAITVRPNQVAGFHSENMDTSKSPSYWSMVCLCNVARLAKETTTVRRVLEPLFNAFDVGNYWSPQKGVASSVLLFLQSCLEESGENCHLLISTLIKHLDHKNVMKQQSLQIDIVNMATYLARNAKHQGSVTITAAIADLVKHLRKCLQNAAEPSVVAGEIKQNSELQNALEKCIRELSNKVGDVGPILDMLSVVLETISTNVLTARTTTSAVLRAADIVSVVPNISYHKKVFPDALFHQLFLAMSHTDWETRVGAHNIFSVLLLQSLLLPLSNQHKKTSEALSGVSSVNRTHKKETENSVYDEYKDKAEESLNGELNKERQISHSNVPESTRQQFNWQSLDNFKDVAGRIKSLSSLRLSSHQVNMLLSSLWIQATSTDNTPANFEAMAHTYNITLLFSRAKTSSHVVLVRCFQLAFSLRSLSLAQDGGMQPSRRRSLFTFASYMLIFTAKVCNLLELIPIIKASLTDQTVDPYLKLEGDSRLRAACDAFPHEGVAVYASEENDVTTFNSILATESDDSRLKEIVISHFAANFETLSEDEASNLKEQILSEFLPDDALPLGAPLYMDTPGPSSPLNQTEFPAFEEVELSAIVAYGETSPEVNGSQSGGRTSLSTNTADILSVNELLESVTETARHVVSSRVSSTPIPYDQMMNQCEALVTGKQQKMSVLQSFKLKETKAISILEEDDDKKEEVLLLKGEAAEDDMKAMALAQVEPCNQHSACGHEMGYNSFRLPPSSPYDKFLKAAGC